MRRVFALCVIALGLVTGPAVAQQPYHWDGGPAWLMNDTTLWWDIVGDHPDSDGYCDNTSGDGEGFPDVDCGHWNSIGPVQNVEQDCGTGSCTVSTTVRCLSLYPKPNPYPYQHLVTFTCSGAATGGNGGVQVGDLGNGKKGVRCGPIECGCQRVHAPGGLQWDENTVTYYYHQFFGFPAMVGGNTANYVCE